MKKIQWDSTAYRMDGRPDFLVSGEFHYFRVPKRDWKRRLELFKAAGGNCVATYIPWILHEPEEGDIRFGDIPQRDLEGFLQLCKDVDISVICRPGPYQYSELRYDGLPGWLCENYPEILARNINGDTFRGSSVSYLHPLFLEKTKRWFEEVCPILAKYTLSNGGPMAFIQVDNELFGIHEWFGGWDYNRESMGIGEEDGRYVLFLKKKYPRMEELNEAYMTQYIDYSQVMPVDPGKIQNDGDRRRTKDYQEFYFRMGGEYLATLTQWIRDAGIDCDIVHNAANPDMNAYFLEAAQEMGQGFILGSDHYYNLGGDWNQNNPTPQYASRIFYSNEILRHMGYPPTVFELPGGSCYDWPPITPEDLRCCYFTNVAFGMKGFNYYIYTGGPNPENTGVFGNVYDYGASIAADGTIRPHYNTQKEFGAFLHHYPWMPEAERIADFNIGLDWDHSRSKSYFSERGRHPFSNGDAWKFMQNGVMTSALCSSFAPNMLDLFKGITDNDRAIPLFVPVSVSMREEAQRNLIDFVKKGGKLILAPIIPYLDENFYPCTLLQDFLEGASAEPCTQLFPTVNVGTVDNVLMNGGLMKSVVRPKAAKAIASEERSGAEVGWRLQFPGGGQVIWLGLYWKHGKLEHGQMMKYLLQESGCRYPIVECDNANIWTSLRENNGHRMLFIMNLLSSPLKGRIKVRVTDDSYTDIGSYTLAPMEVKTVEI